MKNYLFSLYFIFLCVMGFLNADFRQEGSKLKYWNPKYVSNWSVFTARKSRREPYATNITGTILAPFGNNVTVAISFAMKMDVDFRLVYKVCEVLKMSWAVEYLKTYARPPFDKCPASAGAYKFVNIELPPKNIPIPISEGDYTIRMDLFVTSSKEHIVEMETSLHFERKRLIHSG